MVNSHVLLTELMNLRGDFSIPSSCPVLLISETACLIGHEAITAGEPEIRLLASAAFRTRNISTLSKKLVASGAVSQHGFSLPDYFVVFTFPADRSDIHSTLEQIARRTEKSVRLRLLAAERVKMLEEKVFALEQELTFRNNEALDRTRKIVSEWITGCGYTVSVSPELIEQLNALPAEVIGESLSLSLELQRFLHPAKISYTIDASNLQSVASRPAINLSPVTDKALLLLDRYERAAQKALRLTVPLTGKSIAALCEPPVSPPAVTDSLKKYFKQIERLLAKYPESWTNARKALKQLREMDEKRRYSAA